METLVTLALVALFMGLVFMLGYVLAFVWYHIKSKL